MFGVAQQRILGHKIGMCDDRLAKYVVPLFYRIPEWFQMLNWRVNRWLGNKAYGAARCVYVDEATESAIGRGINQFVNLGAGVDTRLHRMSFPSGVKLFEVDTQASQTIKLQLLPSEHLNSDVQFVTCDFETESWIDKLGASGFEIEQPVFIIWEGVSMYLTRGALLDSITQFGRLAPGSVIVLDFFDKPEDRATRGAIKMMDWINEPMHSLFDAAELEKMAQETSIEVTDLMDANSITTAFMTHVDGKPIGVCFPVAHFATLTVA